MWLLVVFVTMRIMRTFLPGVIQLSTDVSWWMLILWPNPAVFAVGWVAGVIAWVAIIRHRERAVVTMVAAIVALLISLFVIAMMVL
jgi:hypothetical protein